MLPARIEIAGGGGGVHGHHHYSTASLLLSQKALLLPDVNLTDGSSAVVAASLQTIPVPNCLNCVCVVLVCWCIAISFAAIC